MTLTDLLTIKPAYEGLVKYSKSTDPVLLIPDAQQMNATGLDDKPTSPVDMNNNAKWGAELRTAADGACATVLN